MLRDLHRRLRPMGFADILDEAIELYRRNFILLFGIGAIVCGPLAVVQLVLKSPTLRSDKVDPTTFLMYFLHTLLVLFIAWIGMIILTGALTFATSENFLGRKTSVLACYGRVLKPSVVFKFVLSNLLAGIATLVAALPTAALIGGGVALLISGRGEQVATIVSGVLLMLLGFAAVLIPIYVATRLCFSTPTFFLESTGPVSALRRSWVLMKGRMLRTFGILAVVSTVVGIVKTVVLAPLMVPLMRTTMANGEPSASILAVQTVVSAVLDAFLTPVSCMALILVYYDARIRSEGFDLEILAAELDRKPGPAHQAGAVELPQEQTLMTSPPPVVEAPEKQETE